MAIKILDECSFPSGTITHTVLTLPRRASSGLAGPGETTTATRALLHTEQPPKTEEETSALTR